MFKNVLVAMMLMCLFVVCGTELCFAGPFETGATNVKTTVITVVQIVAAIAIMAVGVGCMLGKINKIWLVGCLFGAILVFGADQIISWIRTAAGVN
jgi:type IV secretion system protein VirB2